MPVIPADTLRDFATRLLGAGGFVEGDARQTADLLIWANLRGIESHGVLRVPRYNEMVAHGITVSGRDPELVREFGATAVLDGGRCPGAVGMNAAVARAEGLARAHGVGWCSARAISHAGAIGYFTSALARRGLVGLAMTASKPLMSYHGTRGEGVSTNPLSIALPLGQGCEPIVLDMSTAAVALGKIMQAKDAGTPIPVGWGVDADGVETADPADVAALLPMAGAKGSGLSLMIEALASVLPGNAVLGPVLLGLRKEGFNGLVIAVDPAMFSPIEDFDRDMQSLAQAIHALPPAKGAEPVRLPGERGALTQARRTHDGIPLPPGTTKRLIEEAERLSVPVPASLL